MSEEFIIIPGTNRKIYEGTVVVLNRLPNLKWIVHYGFYSYNGKSRKGWYFSSIPSCSVMPVFNEDLVALRVIDDPIPPCPPPIPPCPPHPPVPPFPPFPPVPTPTIFTPADKLMVDRSMITVEALEDRDQLANDDTLNGKLVRVNDSDGEGTPEYYTWNKEDSKWELASLGYRYLTREEIDAKLANGVVDILYSDSNGALVIKRNDVPDQTVNLTGLAHNPIYTADTLTLRIPVFGGNDIVVTIPRDKYLKGVRYEDNYLRPDGTYGPAIVCTISDGVTDSEVVADASMIRNVYYGSETNETRVIIEEGTNKISCEVKLSTIANNALQIDNTGFFVDLSGKVDKNDLREGYLLIADGQGGFTQAGNGLYVAYQGRISDLDDSSRYVVTANMIVQAIDAAVSSAVTSIESRLNAIDRQISSLDSRVTHIEQNPGSIIVDTSGTIVPEAILGDDVLGSEGDKVIATEEAVINAVSFKKFSII